MSFAQRWKQAKENVAEGNKFDDFDPPDGNYTVRIMDTRAWKTADGRDFAKVTLQIAVGEHEGREFDDFNQLDFDWGMENCLRNCSVYGLDVDQIEDLEDLSAQIGEFVGGAAEVTVSHSKKGYVNVKANTGRPANGKPQLDADLTDFKPAPVPPGDDIPF